MRRDLFMAGTGLLCLAMGIAVAASGEVADGAFIGGFILLVSGAVTLLGLWHLRGPWRLVLLPVGLRWDSGAPGWLVPWDEIADVGVYKQNKTRS